MKKFSPVVTVIALTTAPAVGVVVRHKWPTAGPAETARPVAGPASTPAAASRPKPDFIEISLSGFDPQQVKVTQVSQLSVPMELSTPGKLAYSARLTELASTRMAGRLDHILQSEEALVREGQPAAEFYAPDFVSVQKGYLLVLNITRQLKGPNMKDLPKDTDVTVQSVAGRLHVLGILGVDVAQIAKHGTPAEHLTLYVPVSGTTIKHNMDPGVLLNVGDSFMSIVDTRVLQFTGNVYENDVASVHIGQPIFLRMAVYPNHEFAGRISFITPNTDPTMHTLTVHCDMPNTGGLLRPEIYATARIQTGNGQVTVVPETALVKDHGGYYVIVQSDITHFKRVGAHGKDTGTNGNFTVTAGLDVSSRVVVRGAALLSEVVMKAGA